ncbi:N-acetyl-alpha-D-glucosaminyl L-malate synthase [bacterium HR11]|nr:N-acetyl-alpha-D-glucosaminyl L-malate synthase [bacterium HR11]
MRIAFITPGFSGHEADWCIPVVRDLVRAMARSHEVHVFALRYPYRRDRYLLDGAVVDALGGARRTGFRRLVFLQRAWAFILQQVRRWTPDVLHALWADEPGFLAVAVGRRLGIPTVVSVMGGELVALPDIGYGGQLSRLNRWLVRAALRGATRVTVGAQAVYRQAEAWVSPERLLRLPLGVDTQRFHPYAESAGPAPWTEEGIHLLQVASLVPVKDPATALRAVAIVVRHRPDVHLHVVGDGPLRDALRASARDLGLEAHVTFHGAIPHERLPAYYRAARLCVLSSRYESQSMVTLEAAACARTTVGTAVGLIPDLEPATRAVPVGDPEALADALTAVLQEPGTLESMGRACLQAVASGYTLTHTVAHLTTLYEELR